MKQLKSKIAGAWKGDKQGMKKYLNKHIKVKKPVLKLSPNAGCAADCLYQLAENYDLVFDETADEMFTDLGYEIEIPHSPAISPYPQYINCCGIHIEVCPISDGISKYEIVHGYGVRYMPFTVGELKAVAKAVEEMGW